MTVKGVLLMILAALLSAVSQVFLKISARKKHSSSITEYLNIYVILGYGILALTMLLSFNTFINRCTVLWLMTYPRFRISSVILRYP